VGGFVHYGVLVDDAALIEADSPALVMTHV
jgi:hypothetical protein